ncbi:MAG: flagellar basal-body rod protein FlgF [Bacteroidota bacterium]
MLLRLENSFASMTERVREQERIANNLANANTVGYKQDRLFTAALNEWLDAEDAPRSERVRTQAPDFTQGALEETGNTFDVALRGNGFFALRNEATDEVVYSRAGRFTLDAEGTLRTPTGLLVEGEGGPLQIPEEAASIEITQRGELVIDGQPVDRLRLVAFDNPAALLRAEGAHFRAGNQEPLEAEGLTVQQGFVETSNVDPVSTMTEMIEHFRLFESQQKLMQTQSQVLSQVANQLGKF